GVQAGVMCLDAPEQCFRQLQCREFALFDASCKFGERQNMQGPGVHTHYSENFRYQVETVSDQGSVCLDSLPVDRFTDDIRPQTLRLIQRMSHRYHTVCRGGLKLVDEVYDSGKLIDNIIEFALLELESSEQRDVMNLVFGQRHE